MSRAYETLPAAPESYSVVRTERLGSASLAALIRGERPAVVVTNFLPPACRLHLLAEVARRHLVAVAPPHLGDVVSFPQSYNESLRRGELDAYHARAADHLRTFAQLSSPALPELVRAALASVWKGAVAPAVINGRVCSYGMVRCYGQTAHEHPHVDALTHGETQAGPRPVQLGLRILLAQAGHGGDMLVFKLRHAPVPRVKTDIERLRHPEAAGEGIIPVAPQHLSRPTPVVLAEGDLAIINANVPHAVAATCPDLGQPARKRVTFGMFALVDVEREAGCIALLS